MRLLVPLLALSFVLLEMIAQSTTTARSYPGVEFNGQETQGLREASAGADHDAPVHGHVVARRKRADEALAGRTRVTTSLFRPTLTQPVSKKASSTEFESGSPGDSSIHQRALARFTITPDVSRQPWQWSSSHLEPAQHSRAQTLHLPCYDSARPAQPRATKGAIGGAEWDTSTRPPCAGAPPLMERSVSRPGATHHDEAQNQKGQGAAVTAPDRRPPRRPRRVRQQRVRPPRRPRGWRRRPRRPRRARERSATSARAGPEPAQMGRRESDTHEGDQGQFVVADAEQHSGSGPPLAVQNVTSALQAAGSSAGSTPVEDMEGNGHNGQAGEGRGGRQQASLGSEVAGPSADGGEDAPVSNGVSGDSRSLPAVAVDGSINDDNSGAAGSGGEGRAVEPGDGGGVDVRRTDGVGDAPSPLAPAEGHVAASAVQPQPESVAAAPAPALTQEHVTAPATGPALPPSSPAVVGVPESSQTGGDTDLAAGGGPPAAAGAPTNPSLQAQPDSRPARGGARTQTAPDTPMGSDSPSGGGDSGMDWAPVMLGVAGAATGLLFAAAATSAAIFFSMRNTARPAAQPAVAAAADPADASVV
eukprot:jgi/Ulvmu1/8467/UM043_0047.1